MSSSITTSHSEQLIRQMVCFIETGSLTEFTLLGESPVEKRTMRLLCIALLGWLRFGSQKPRLRALHSREFGSAASLAESLLRHCNAFKKTFSQNGSGEIFLQNGVEREMLCDLAAQLYSPMRFTTLKR
jgi:hypothetical protein